MSQEENEIIKLMREAEEMLDVLYPPEARWDERSQDACATPRTYCA